MFASNVASFSHRQKYVITSISFGNILEWYDIYSYGILAPVIAKNFFSFWPEFYSLLSALILFGLGAIIRPFSVMFFGKIADHNLSGKRKLFTRLANLSCIGRKPAFLISVLITTTATFLTGFLGTYESWGISATILLIFFRIVASIGLSAEYTGAICFLYENSYPTNARRMTSFAGIANQLGAIVVISEILLFSFFTSDEFIHLYEWRVSFWTGGVLGLLIFFLRAKLSETPLYEAIEEKNKFDRETTFQIVKNNYRKILIGIGYGLINASTYYFLALYLPTFLVKELGISSISTRFISLLILVSSTGLIYVFGRIGEKYSNKKLLLVSTYAILILTAASYYAIYNKNILFLTIICLVYVFPVSCITALICFQLSILFKTDVRFTCVGVSWNIADAVVGSLTPAILIALQIFINFPASLCILIILTGVISIACYRKIPN